MPEQDFDWLDLKNGRVSMWRQVFFKALWVSLQELCEAINFFGGVTRGA